MLAIRSPLGRLVYTGHHDRSIDKHARGVRILCRRGNGPAGRPVQRHVAAALRCAAVITLPHPETALHAQARCSRHAGGWSDFGACSASENDCTQTRSCTNPAPANGGTDCSGASSQACDTDACSTNATASSTGGSDTGVDGVPSESSTGSDGSSAHAQASPADELLPFSHPLSSDSLLSTSRIGWRRLCLTHISSLSQHPRD